MLKTALGRLFVLIALLTPVSNILAEELQTKENWVVEEWVIKARPGELDQFMTALQSHAAWRQENKDPWEWKIFTPTFGSMTAGVWIRSPAHLFEENIEYANSEFNISAERHFQETVTPFVESATRYLKSELQHARYWPRDDYQFLLVTTARPANLEAMVESRNTLVNAYREAGGASGIAEYWTYFGGGSHITFVEGFTDWAAMSETSPEHTKLFQLLRSKLGDKSLQEMYTTIWGDQALTDEYDVVLYQQVYL